MDAFIRPDWIPINFSDISNKSLSCAKQGQKDLKGHTNGEDRHGFCAPPPNTSPLQDKKKFYFHSLINWTNWSVLVLQ